jgi:hypothetical protein
MISKWLGVNLNHQTPYFGVWRRANVLLVSPWRRGRVMSAGEGQRLPPPQGHRRDRRAACDGRLQRNLRLITAQTIRLANSAAQNLWKC